MAVTGYKWKAKLTIDNTKVGADLTNYPVYLTVGNVPPLMVDANGGKPCIDGGGDIAFSSDISGVTELSREIVNCQIDDNPALALVQIWVKVPAVSSSVPTVFWIWWGKVGATQPAVGAAFGRNSVWTGPAFGAVLHLSENNTTTAGNYVDSTGNGNTFNSPTNAKTPTRTSWANGKLGYSQDMDDVNNDNIGRAGALTGITSDTFTGSVWVRRTSTSGGTSLARVFSHGNDDRFDVGVDSTGAGGPMSFISNGAGATGGWVTNGLALSDSNWHQLQFSHNSGTVSSYKDATKTTRAYTVRNEGRQPCIGGKYAANETLEALYDEFRWTNGVALSDGWITTDFNSQNSPSTFLSASVPMNTHGNDFFTFFSD
jgi:hypothetical protein